MWVRHGTGEGNSPYWQTEDLIVRSLRSVDGMTAAPRISILAAKVCGQMCPESGFLDQPGEERTGYFRHQVGLQSASNKESQDYELLPFTLFIVEQTPHARV